MVGKLVEEKSFPRGASEVKPTDSQKICKPIKKKERDLFSSKNETISKKKKVKRKSKHKKSSIFDVNLVHVLSYSQLSEVIDDRCIYSYGSY